MQVQILHSATCFLARITQASGLKTSFRNIIAFLDFQMLYSKENVCLKDGLWVICILFKLLYDVPTSNRENT